MLIAEINRIDAEKWEIISIQIDREKYILPGSKYLNIPIEIGKILKPELNMGSKIHFFDEITDKHTGDIKITDFNIVKPGGLNQAKNELLSKISNNFSYNLASITGINYFIFAMASFELANAGHFITSENREEKYVEIMNSNDAVLIENLNNYLSALDEISPVANLYNEFKSFKKRVKQSITIEELEKVKDMFSNFV